MFAIVVLAYYLYKQVRTGARMVYVVTLAMILAGAAGNLVDCMFYGMIFSSSSPFYVSYFVPFGEGYAPFLMGKVVDMFYFPLVVTTWPQWVPFFGGEQFVFFSPVFNFADAAISCGIIALILFYNKKISQLQFKKQSS